jgi:hypothetical protein
MIRLLKIAAFIPLAVGLMHMSLGLGAEALLGGAPSADALANPSLDSQNRFYGAEFTLYGVLLWLCTTDMHRFAPVLRLLLFCLFLGGIARLISYATHGWPAPAIIALWASEVIIPPAMILWLRRHRL